MTTKITPFTSVALEKVCLKTVTWKSPLNNWHLGQLLQPQAAYFSYFQ